MPDTQIIMYGTSWCGDCWRSKQLLDKSNIPYQWIDIDQVPDAADFVRRLNGGNRSVPTIVFPEGDTLVEPSESELKARLGLL